jgi:hypothetical protein
MEVLTLAFLILAIVGQILNWVSNTKWRGLYAHHRHLDHMPATAMPQQMKRFWGRTGIWGNRMRNVFAIASIAFFALSLLL